MAIEFHVPAHGSDFRHYLDDPDFSGLHHVARYEWACRTLRELKPKRLLDIASGGGYGTAMIAEASPESRVVGCDYAPEAVEFATQTHRGPNLQYVTGSMVTWRDANGDDLGRFDAIVSFDTLEHIGHRDIALMRVANAVTDNGVFLLSTPCAHDETLLDPPWEHHKLEYSYRDLLPLMRRFFRVVLQVSDATFPHRDFWLSEVNGTAVRYPNVGNPLFCREPVRV